MPTVATVQTGTISGGATYTFQPASGQHYLVLGFSYTVTQSSVVAGIQVNGSGNVSFVSTDQVIGDADQGRLQDHVIPIGYDASWTRLDYYLQNPSTQHFVIHMLNITDVAKVVGGRNVIAGVGNSGTAFRPPAGKMWIYPHWTTNGAAFMHLQVVRASDSTAIDAFLNHGGSDMAMWKTLAIFTDDYYPRWANTDTSTFEGYVFAVEMDELSGAFAILFATTTTDFTPAAGVEWMVRQTGYYNVLVQTAAGSHYLNGPANTQTHGLIDSSMSIRLGANAFATVLVPDL